MTQEKTINANALRDMSHCFDLTGKVVIVTGGGGILGRHFCSGLAQHGATVIVADLSKKAAEETTRQIEEQFGLKTFPKQLDVSDEDSVKDLVNELTEDYGHIDVLHNNAATKSSRLESFFDPVETYDLGIWQEIMKVNVDGMFLMAKHVGSRMARQESGGSIIQTSSIYGLVAPDQRIYEGSSYMGIPINTPAVYSVSKAAVIGLSQYLSTYWLGKNIRVNTLTPGGVESGQNETFQRKYAARVPLGRMARPNELVGALIFLASDASSYITGQNLVVDGGISVW